MSSVIKNLFVWPNLSKHGLTMVGQVPSEGLLDYPLQQYSYGGNIYTVDYGEYLDGDGVVDFWVRVNCTVGEEDSFEGTHTSEVQSVGAYFTEELLEEHITSNVKLISKAIEKKGTVNVSHVTLDTYDFILDKIDKAQLGSTLDISLSF